MNGGKYNTMKLWILTSVSGIFLGLTTWFGNKYEESLTFTINSLQKFSERQREINEKVSTLLENHEGKYQLLVRQLEYQEKYLEELNTHLQQLQKDVDAIKYKLPNKQY